MRKNGQKRTKNKRSLVAFTFLRYFCNRLLLKSKIQPKWLVGVLGDCPAEMIPVKPDPDNAGVGIASISYGDIVCRQKSQNLLIRVIFIKDKTIQENGKIGYCW